MSSLTEGVADISISLPNLIGGNGILETLPLPLSTVESAKLNKSAEILRAEIKKINL
jgi:L-lactate dehydrogenase